MACDNIQRGDGTQVIMCGPRKRRPPCKVTGCRAPATILCDFPLSGAAAGKTCSKALCRAHAVKQIDVTPFPHKVVVRLVPGAEPIEVLIPGEEDTVDFCPAHDKLVVRRT